MLSLNWKLLWDTFYWKCTIIAVFFNRIYIKTPLAHQLDTVSRMFCVFSLESNKRAICHQHSIRYLNWCRSPLYLYTYFFNFFWEIVDEQSKEGWSLSNTNCRREPVNTPITYSYTQNCVSISKLLRIVKIPVIYYTP